MSPSRPAVFIPLTVLACTTFIAGAQTGGNPPPTGFKSRRPVLGGACKICPWGALGEIVKTALQPYGYDVQMCYNCNFAEAPLIVADAKLPPPYRRDPTLPEILAPASASANRTAAGRDGSRQSSASCQRASRQNKVTGMSVCTSAPKVRKVGALT